MFSSQPWSTQLAFAFTLASLVRTAASLDISYCSSLNTASTGRNSSIYQSNGLCHDFCLSDYAFAIVQDDGCWCSNYVPGTTTTGCTQTCPGFPLELCGGSGVYGYIALSKAPSGTEGASTAASTPTTAALVTVTATPDAVTLFSTFTAEPIQSPTTSSSTDITTPSTTPSPAVTTPAASPRSSTSATSTSSSSSSAWIPTPVTSLETVTGQVETVTVTPTGPPNSANLYPVSKSSGGIGTGGAVGLTIGLVALVAIIWASVWFFLRRKNAKKGEEAGYNDISRRGSTAGTLAAASGTPGTGPSRTMSENSRYVLGTDGRRVVETWEQDPKTPGLRTSHLTPVDPRLDPFAPVYQRENRSRESVNTIRDDHDYSRRVHQQGVILRATNPDE